MFNAVSAAESGNMIGGVNSITNIISKFDTENPLLEAIFLGINSDGFRDPYDWFDPNLPVSQFEQYSQFAGKKQ